MKARAAGGGIAHGKRCACPGCDPEQKLLAAARERHLAEVAAAARLRAEGKLPPPPDPPPAPPRRARSIAPSTRAADVRFRELLRQGVGVARALEMVDAEQRNGDPNGKED